MKRILVPVDFSPTSKKAFRLAVDIASRSGGSIMLYHLYTPAKKYTAGTYSDARTVNQQLERDGLKRLQRLAKKVLPDQSNVPVSTIIGRTPVVNNILGFAEHNLVDMIVMGTQGASGLKKVIIGSVAAKIIKKSEIPVLLVPEKFELAPIKKIVFATGFQTADRTAFHFIFSFAGFYDALVTFVNLAGANAQDKQDRQKSLENYGFVLQREFNDSRMQFQQLITTSVEGTMENLHTEIPYDLLVMARRKRGFPDRIFHKSFTKKMAYITTKPLLIVPET